MIYTAFFSPLDIAFQFSGKGLLVYQILDWITLIIFVLDIFVNLRTTYFTYNDDEILEPKKIAKNYVYSASFLFDLVSTIPLSELS